MSERPNCNRQMGRSNPPAGSTSQEAMGHFVSEQFPDDLLDISNLDSSKNVLDQVFGLLKLEIIRMELKGLSSTELLKCLFMKAS